MPVDPQVLIEANAVCVQAVQEARKVVLEYFRQPLAVEFKEKGQQSPVTEADRRSEDILRAALTRAFPDHAIIGEEGEDVVHAQTDYMWFLDPLDGTTNFATGLPAFAISMGLCYRSVPVLGVVAVPWEGPQGTIFRAYQGGGAFCNDMPIRVVADEVPAGTRVASMPFWALWQYRVARRANFQKVNVRATGSIAYELVYAARGTFQLSVISGARLWDMIASVVLVQEAGGSVLFCNGKARRWNTWEDFLRGALSKPFGEDVAALRALHIYMLAGNAQAVQQRARQMRLRRVPTWWQRCRQTLMKVWKAVQSATTPRKTPPVNRQPAG